MFNDEIWFAICGQAFAAPSLIAFKKLRLLNKNILSITENFNVFDPYLIMNKFPERIWIKIYKIFINDDYNWNLVANLNKSIYLVGTENFYWANQPGGIFSLINYDGLQDRLMMENSK
jgi:hypothetical protein